MEEKELDNIPQEISEEEEIKAPKGEGIKDVKEGIQGGIDDVEMAPIVKESFLDYAMSVIVSRHLINHLRNPLVSSVMSWVNITHTAIAQST